MKRIALCLIFILVFTLGCSQNEIKENQVYVVNEMNYSQENIDDLNLEGRMPFEKYIDNNFELDFGSEQILLTISPDGKEIYLMEKEQMHSYPQVIMGDPTDNVRIIRKNIFSNEQEIIIENIPFVSNVLWNAKENIVAFGGGERLTLYDVRNNSIIMEEKLAQDSIINFFWSPNDNNKIYTEQPDLANASIYYLSSQKKVEAYETREEAYYKGKLDSNYYYGTRWDLTSGEIETVILDKQGKVIKSLMPGRFRGAYGKSLVTIDDSGFGLYYIKDVNNPEKILTLTEEFVYDVKFIADGKIAFTTRAKDIGNNMFYLHIINANGVRLKKLEVQGGRIAVSPDGNFGYVNGPRWQKVDFIQNTLVPDNNSSVVEEAESLQEIHTTIRGAMLTLYNFKLNGERNWDNLNKYYIDSQSPDQCAHFDIEHLFKETATKRARQNYSIKITIKDFEINNNGRRASVIVGVNTKNPHGKGDTIDYSLELIKVDNNWYVTGFSTFPNSQERENIGQIVRDVVKNIEELKNREVTIGQIQFWRRGVQNFAVNVESANLVKVYLKVHGEEKPIYKLILEKVSQNNWELTKLDNENLTSL